MARVSKKEQNRRSRDWKNSTSYGAKMHKMNDATYALRRNVIEAIYELKKHVNLPRIEVRIVDAGDGGYCGYAYLNSNVIHIRDTYASDQYKSKASILHLTAHEVVHAVTGFEHDKDCYLMQPYHVVNPDVSKSIEAFKKYFK